MEDNAEYDPQQYDGGQVMGERERKWEEPEVLEAQQVWLRTHPGEAVGSGPVQGERFEPLPHAPLTQTLLTTHRPQDKRIKNIKMVPSEH